MSCNADGLWLCHYAHLNEETEVLKQGLASQPGLSISSMNAFIVSAMALLMTFPVWCSRLLSEHILLESDF